MLNILKTSSKILVPTYFLSQIGSNLPENSLTANCSTKTKENETASKRHAIAVLQKVEGSSVFGLVSFSQENFSSEMLVVGNIFKANPNTEHSLQVHQFGDLIGNGKNIGTVFDGNIPYEGIFEID